MGLTYPSNKICPRCGTGGYVWYLDNSEYVAKCTNCNHYFRREDFPMCVLDEAPKPITNDDLINAMSVEEKAEWLSQFECSAGCKARRDACGYGNNCYKAWIEWLKKEADDGIL